MTPRALEISTEPEIAVETHTSMHNMTLKLPQ